MAVAESLKALVIAAVVIDSVGLGLRSFARARVQGSFGYDDAVLSLSLIGYIIFVSFTLVALHYGYGVLTPEPWHDSTQAIKFFFLSQLAYVLTGIIVKVGIALVLIRINIQRSIRNIIVVALTLFLISAIAFLFLLVLQCRPISSTWVVGQGSCFEYNIVQNSGIAFSAADIATNFLYSSLPIIMLYRVQMSLHLKLSAMFLLGMGFLSSIATVVRYRYIVAVPDRHKTLDKFKEIENNLTVIAWTHVEIFLAILATSLIAVRPLLKRAGELIDTWRRGRTSSPSKAEEEHELANDRVRSGSSRSRDQEENGYSSEVSLGNDGERVKLPHM
ncbi:hypothetical protein NUW58_g717 [Xylaria curta]|uniref:Uncharacterized protein n=1 Tax=Xylaria curta TaxID=42375 RepID=A0ACC1PR52_9PEZI|nr:hypothetical protein NUW58_g717 [Xylaria curta]